MDAMSIRGGKNVEGLFWLMVEIQTESASSVRFSSQNRLAVLAKSPGGRVCFGFGARLVNFSPGSGKDSL
jgi:hypothetical protein